MRQQNVADAAAHLVRAFAVQFGDDIAAVVHQEEIVAGSADQGVGTRAAIQRVVAGQAVDRVAGGCAGESLRSGIAGDVQRHGAHLFACGVITLGVDTVARSVLAVGLPRYQPAAVGQCGDLGLFLTIERGTVDLELRAAGRAIAGVALRIDTVA